jgi:hypothetical protein
MVSTGCGPPLGGGGSHLFSRLKIRVQCTRVDQHLKVSYSVIHHGGGCHTALALRVKLLHPTPPPPPGGAGICGHTLTTLSEDLEDLSNADLP